jgi:2-oxoisovalerate dehydrogenase E2 component (dihydrolipoyl transacylase)
MLKRLGLNFADIKGTGRAGRVLKEDVQRHFDTLSQAEATTVATTPPAESKTTSTDSMLPLTPTEKQMFKVMTRSTTIPHFTYTHAVDLSTLTALRKKANSVALASSNRNATKLTPLPFVLKAVSEAFAQFPKLNAHLNVDKSGEAGADTAQLVLKASHNIGIAVDTVHGLLVPVVRDVQSKSIQELAAEIKRLGELARAGKLAPADFQGATFTVSNIGSIGGAAVSPVIVGPQVGILGVGRARVVAGFEGEGDSERIVKREEVVLSWAADHRVLDGATVARCAEMVGDLLENADVLSVKLR